MNRLRMITMCLLAMMAASLSVKAQEVTITLFPGWNWISYPNSVAMGVNEALGTFAPMDGDKIKGQFSNSSYNNGYWRGGVTHFMPGMGYMYYSSRNEVTSFVFTTTTNSIVMTNTPTDITAVSAVVGGTVTIEEGNHIYARGVCWGTEPSPNIDGNHTSDAIGTGIFSTTLIGLTPNTILYVRAYIVTDYGLEYGEEQSFTTLDVSSVSHEYVDLGLPSGLLWATCNIGADVPESYGDYFAWGETQPKDYYEWNTYQYCMGSQNMLTKYCNNPDYGYNGYTDNLIILLPEDDAATANWGSDWRMPTQAEFQELLDNTTVTWTTQNGVNGRLFTASNGNSLFLPAAGYRSDSGLSYAGIYGGVWSSSLDTFAPDKAWKLYFGSGGNYIGSIERRYGRSVRPVRSSAQK